MSNRDQNTAVEGPPTTADEDRLLRYVDGRLDNDTEVKLTARIAGEPALRRRVTADRNADTIVRAAFDPVLDEPMPLRLRYARYEQGGSMRRTAAGLFIALCLGAAIGWFASENGFTINEQLDSLPASAVQAHRTFVVEKRHPVEVAATEEAHLVQWLTRRVGAPVKAPDLSRFGYALMGGRLLPATNSPAAQLMYETREGRRLTLYLAPEIGQDETAFRYIEATGVAGFWWREEGLGYAMLAEGDKDNLLPIARGVWEALQHEG